jgi:hypothetical protein
MKYLKILMLLVLFSLKLQAQKREILNTSYYSQKDITDAYQESQCKLDIYLPNNNNKALPVIVWFHGGGLKGGTKAIPEELKNDKFIIVSAAYRLSPKVHSPAFIEDAAASVAWVFNNIQKYGGDTSKIFLSGHSAGGYLALMLTMDESWLLKQNISNNKIKACIPLSPQVITHFTIRAENNIKDVQPVINEFAPMNFIKATTPIIIDITGDRELELLGRYEENAYFVRMMKLAGNKNISLYELQGFSHGSMHLPGIHLMYQEIDKILNKK